MTILYHPFDSERDSKAVARSFTRLGYESTEYAGVPLDTTNLRYSLTESGLRYVYTTQDGGRVIGTIILLEHMDGFVAGPDEFLGDHYLVDPLHHGDLISGRLLTTTFRYLITAEVGTVRLGVNPANKVARRLYAWARLRAVGPPISNGDGFVEMVSHLPDTLHLPDEEEGITDTYEAPLRILKHFMRRIRHSGGRRGVNAHTDGTRTTIFDFDLHQRFFYLVLNIHSGRLIVLNVDGSPRGDLVVWVRGAGVPAAPGLTEPSAPHSIECFSARINERDSLVAEHPGYAGPILVDPFPDGHSLQITPLRPPSLPLSTEKTP